jgi:hypothetical protein
LGSQSRPRETAARGTSKTQRLSSSPQAQPAGVITAPPSGDEVLADATGSQSRPGETTATSSVSAFMVTAQPGCRAASASPSAFKRQSRPKETLRASVLSIRIMPGNYRAGFTNVNTSARRSHAMITEGRARRVAPGRQLRPRSLEWYAVCEFSEDGLTSPVL